MYVDHVSIIVICSNMETGLGIFASCLPPLHRLITIPGRKSRLERPAAQGRAEATIGGTPMSTFDPTLTVRITEETAPIVLDTQWSGLPDEDSSCEYRSTAISAS